MESRLGQEGRDNGQETERDRKGWKFREEGQGRTKTEVCKQRLCLTVGLGHETSASKLRPPEVGRHVYTL